MVKVILTVPAFLFSINIITYIFLKVKFKRIVQKIDFLKNICYNYIVKKKKED